jgi:GT2 family glycosyltransferase
MKKKFAFGIPTYNRWDLLEPNLQKYIKDFPDIDIHIIDNGNQNIPQSDKYFLHNFERNLGVASSWNYLCSIIFEKYDYAVILNDDIYLGYGEDVINKAIDNDFTGFIQSYCSWSVFVIFKELYKYIGKFDETFYPAYFEDSDYLYRLKLLGLIQTVDSTLNPSVFLISQTYEKDPDFVNASRMINSVRYQNKWGGLPLLETYIFPYNKTK